MPSPHNPITRPQQKSKGFFNFNELAESKNQTLVLTHIMTGKQVQFPAFIMGITDDYAVSWGSETIFGRMDAIKPYSGTQRKISVRFKILAPDLSHAKYNFRKLSLLSQMMYPVYSEQLTKGNNSGRTIKGPPLLRVKFMNIIQNKATADNNGLLAAVNGFKMEPNIEAGWYMDDKDKNLYPKECQLDMTFDVLHEQTPGFDEKGEFIINDYPYGTRAYKSSDSPFSNSVALGEQDEAAAAEVANA